MPRSSDISRHISWRRFINSVFSIMIPAELLMFAPKYAFLISSGMDAIPLCLSRTHLLSLLSGVNDGSFLLHFIIMDRYNLISSIIKCSLRITISGTISGYSRSIFSRSEIPDTVNFLKVQSLFAT